ncbi:MAG: hypothetical protein L0Z50_12520 [Verrucomicrobiales bacterium]|nr:hypothetical protein [Verrucomicrobiales bacterium]
MFMTGLVLSGVTAIPLKTEIDWLVRQTGAEPVLRSESLSSTGMAAWLISIRDAVHEVGAKYPFLAYGTDWLAFGHFVIALAFFGLLRDPVRNRWLIDFGLIACVLVLPYALIFGGLRGIPLGWRLIDCSFGVFGALPLWYCRRCVDELERVENGFPSGERPARILNP